MELFGGMPDAVKFIIVFMLILAILVPLLWRRFSVGPLSPLGPRGRQPRLAVIDSAAVDVRRRLVLIKRDNVEHLLMIGGPVDIVVEANIARTGTVAREPRPIPDIARPEIPQTADAPDWSLPLEQTRPLRTADLDAALPEPPVRTAREAMVDSMRAVRSGAAARRSPAEVETPPEEVVAPALMPAPAEGNHRPQPVPELRRTPLPPEPPRPMPMPMPEPAAPVAEMPPPKRNVPPPPPRSMPPVPPPAPVAVPPPPPPPPARPAQPMPVAAAGPATPPPRSASSDESSLAEMAQRLEAALRRPTRPAEAPPVRAPSRSEPSAGRKGASLDAVTPSKANLKPSDSSPPELKVLTGKGKSDPIIDSLEDEMAKVLGRSPGKL
jgi:flagellar protein FliO/FliZ